MKAFIFKFIFNFSKILSEIGVILNLQINFNEENTLLTWEPPITGENCGVNYLIKLSTVDDYFSINTTDTFVSFVFPLIACSDITIEILAFNSNGNVGIPTEIVVDTRMYRNMFYLIR